MPPLDWTLLFSAFLSATLLPGSSEALLLLRIEQGGDPAALVVVAAVGNLLGSLSTYAIGRGGNLVLQRWLRIDEGALRRAERWFQRWGTPTLLLAWLPVVGDPLCLAAGLLQVRLWLFTVMVAIGKFARYAVLAWLVV